MIRVILAFFIVFSFIGCERKDGFDEIIEKLKAEQNKSGVNKPIFKTPTMQTNLSRKLEKQKDELKKIVQTSTMVNKEEKAPEIKKVSNLTLKTTDGKLLHLKFTDDGIEFAEYHDKIVILDIFTTWCPPCMESFPHLSYLQKKYKGKLQIIGVLMEENKKDSEIDKFKKEHHINYEVSNCPENFTLVNNWGGVSGYPTIVIFDKNGTYFNHYNGSPPTEMLESDIKQVLKKGK